VVGDGAEGKKMMDTRNRIRRVGMVGADRASQELLLRNTGEDIRGAGEVGGQKRQLFRAEDGTFWGHRLIADSSSHPSVKPHGLNDSLVTEGLLLQRRKGGLIRSVFLTASSNHL